MPMNDDVLFISLLLFNFSWKVSFPFGKNFHFFLSCFFTRLRFLFLEDIYEIFYRYIEVVSSFIYKSYLEYEWFSMDF